LCAKVTQIYDHHIDLDVYRDTVNYREIRLIGSAQTIVLKHLIDEFLEQTISHEEWALFSAAPLLLDSSNFSPALEGSKWTLEDKEVYEKLLKVAPVGKEYYE